jgi:hypothetical protein
MRVYDGSTGDTILEIIGQSKSFYVSVDGADGGLAIVTECDEANNEGITETVSCPVPG